MKFVLFYHSLLSDWNHGNAHFLRGYASELLARGHQVEVYEPTDGWSLRQLIASHNETALAEFRAHYPELTSRFYMPDTLDLDRALDGADVVIVHEWNDPQLVRRIGEYAARADFHLFFHDTHHRSVTDPQAMQRLDLRHYDGVLAFGGAIAERYLSNGWAQYAWIWHEAADVRRFKPLDTTELDGDLVWVGNWGDDERSAELREFLIQPVAQLRMKAKIYGVRYPAAALAALGKAKIDYGGWIPNACVPGIFSRYTCTVHVPRQAYAQSLPGIPTIRMFEALACGKPLVSAPWDDCEQLFRPGIDYLVANTGNEMQQMLRAVIDDRELASSLAVHGLETIRAHHTCRHRLDQLLEIVAGLDAGRGPAWAPAAGECA